MSLLSRGMCLSLAAVMAVMLTACGPRAQTPAARATALAQPSAAGPVAVPLAQAAPAPGALSGRMLFVQAGDLWMWQNGSSHQVTTGETWRQPAWSPDGSRFAYVLHGVNFSDIALSNLTGTAEQRLTRSQSTVLEDNYWNQRPAWSPDGTQIAFISDRSTEFPTLWIMNADGSGQRPLTIPGLQLDGVDAVSWAPDGSRLAVTAYPGQDTTQIAVVPLGSSTTTRGVAKLVTAYPSGAVDPAFSPDGNWLAYAARDGGGVAIFVSKTDGSGAVRLTAGTDEARAPTFSPDGRHLAYLSAKGGTVDLWAQDLAFNNGTVSGSNETQLTQNMGLDGQSGITWSP